MFLEPSGLTASPLITGLPGKRSRRMDGNPREVSCSSRERAWAHGGAAPHRIDAAGLRCRAHRQQDFRKETTYVNTNPGGGDGSRFPVLLVVAAVAAVAAQSEAWASAVGTAVALYSVLTTGNRRN